MNWDDLLENIIKNAGVIGVKSVERVLDDLQEQADTPWKRTVLGMLGDAVEQYGWEGIAKMEKALDAIVAGKQPDLSFASLKARSDALAFMQNAEAEDKSETKDFFLVIGEGLGVLLKAIIQGLL